jgi:hypothetical protein
VTATLPLTVFIFTDHPPSIRTLPPGHILLFGSEHEMPLQSVQRLVSSNDVPSALEEASIHEEIDESLSQKISKFRLELQYLEDRRQKRRVVLSAIRKIPIEVFGRSSFSSCHPC